MADSEVKARRKLEEAEKKSRGGGGFLGKLFGGSGADEAADLFIQCGTEPFPGSASSTEDNVLEAKDNFDLDDGEFSPMECDVCYREFPDLVAFESHYTESHSHQCTACAKMFVSQRALEVHSDEKHCPFHCLRVEVDLNGRHYKCYNENCDNAYTSPVERDQHCYEKHNISTIEVSIEKRKLPRRLNEVRLSLGKLDVSEKKKKRKSVPRSIKFGDQEKSFERLRSSKTDAQKSNSQLNLSV